MALVSAIVLSRPDSKKLANCLKSLDWADEKIVIKNSNITDFSKIRNQAAKKAKGDWLFYVDDDERCTPPLRDEILKLVKDDGYSAYDIPRKNIILGQWMRHMGQWPDRVLRLIKKDALVGWEGQLHEQPKIKGLSAGRWGKLGHLENPLLHQKHDNLEEMVAKTNDWSEVEAGLMFEAKHPPMNIPRFCTAMAREFWQRMIIQAAFLDGPKGIIYALYQVFSRFVSYAKLWEIQNARGNL